MDFVFNPTVKALYPSSLDYAARYNIKSAGLVTNAILKNYSIAVSAFRLQSFVSYVISVDTYVCCYTPLSIELSLLWLCCLQHKSFTI